MQSSEIEVTTYLQTQSHFTVQEVSKTNCAFFLFGENDYIYTGVAKWGPNGYVLTAQKTPGQEGKIAILAILNSTVITKPCSP